MRGVLRAGVRALAALAALATAVSVHGREQGAQDQVDFADGLYVRGMYRLATEEYDTFIKNWPDDEALPTVL